MLIWCLDFDIIVILKSLMLLWKGNYLAFSPQTAAAHVRHLEAHNIPAGNVKDNEINKELETRN